MREGFLAMDEVAELFAATDTVALPYRAASQSGVLLLAYGFERPVIVYPVGGLVEAVVEGETGWICRRADPEALAEALAESVAAGPAECCAARRSRGQAGRGTLRLAGDRTPHRRALLRAHMKRAVILAGGRGPACAPTPRCCPSR